MTALKRAGHAQDMSSGHAPVQKMLRTALVLLGLIMGMQHVEV